MNTTAPSTRLDSVRFLVQRMIDAIPCAHSRQDATAYLYGVSAFAAMLAARRQLNQELAAIAGLLHRYYEYRTGIRDFPGPNNAEAVRPLLRDLALWTTDDQTTILRAIFYQAQASPADRQEPYARLLADARLLHAHFHQLDHVVAPYDAPNLKAVLQEFNMPQPLSRVQPQSVAHPRPPAPPAERRSKLADFAEQLAERNVVGVCGDPDFREICSYWPDADIYLTLRNSWCAAFVYHCCRHVGIDLPIRYPNGIHRLAGVGAWLEWAQLPETGFFHRDGQQGFVPQRGDIVIYDKLLSEEAHDHIGIVLGCDDSDLRVAEGNKDNRNVSSVFKRARHHSILGYVRISNHYLYHFHGEYTPLV